MSITTSSSSSSSPSCSSSSSSSFEIGSSYEAYTGLEILVSLPPEYWAYSRFMFFLSFLSQAPHNYHKWPDLFPLHSQHSFTGTELKTGSEREGNSNEKLTKFWIIIWITSATSIHNEILDHYNFFFLFWCVCMCVMSTHMWCWVLSFIAVLFTKAESLTQLFG